MSSDPHDFGAFTSMFAHAENFRCVVKDRQHRYVYVNQSWLDSLGFESESEVLGKTALDLFPAWRAERYMQEEREVMEKGSHLDFLDDSATPSGGNERWRNLKAPWIRNGRVVGMTNLAMLVEERALEEKRGDMIPHVVAWMTKHAAETLSIAEIAEQCNMSRRSLERYFMEKTGESPARYRTHCRIEQAKALLQDSATDLTEIAARCGFYDQSHFTRVFSKEAGVTPRKWRDRGGG
jgi:PAS domain S-box-containing protein